MSGLPAMTLPKLLDKWAKIALDSNWVQAWAEGAILPSEMVFFLARCEEMDIQCVVESGRQDGYSTRLLGEFARRQGEIEIYSVDTESDQIRAENCRKYLAEYRKLHLLKGNSISVLGQLLEGNSDSPTAVLVDGPKGFLAMSLLFASAGYEQVKLLALHNLEQGSPERAMFERQADQPVCYEAFASQAGEYWHSLKNAEIAFRTSGGMTKPLGHSSLCVMPVSTIVRSRLASLFHPVFAFYQPTVVRLLWHLHLYDSVKYLASASHRLWG